MRGIPAGADSTPTHCCPGGQRKAGPLKSKEGHIRTRLQSASICEYLEVTAAVERVPAELLTFRDDLYCK